MTRLVPLNVNFRSASFATPAPFTPPPHPLLTLLLGAHFALDSLSWGVLPGSTWMGLMAAGLISANSCNSTWGGVRRGVFGENSGMREG